MRVELNIYYTELLTHYCLGLHYSIKEIKKENYTLLFLENHSHYCTCTCICYFTPVQVTPLPLYPAAELHVHVNPPSVFSQLAFVSQLCVSSVHSSSSIILNLLELVID